MIDCPENPRLAMCNECGRRGFTWARGNCQYCGHRQYDDGLFASERDLRNHLNDEAIAAFNLARRMRRQASAGHAIDGSCGDGFLDFGGDDGGGGD